MNNGDNEKRSHEETPECFVIMPIGEKPGYPPNHFERVFEDIFCPACENAGFRARHAGQVKEANLIHLDILQRLLQAPMALCDLSSHSPNVLFELGLRQAFDRPVVLVQEAGTPKIFDIAPLRVEMYRRERIFHEVLEDQQRIARAIADTKGAKRDSVNSIVRLLGVGQAAHVPVASEKINDPGIQLIRAEINNLRDEILNVIPRGTSAMVRNDEAGTLRTELLNLSHAIDRGISVNAFHGLHARLDEIKGEITASPTMTASAAREIIELVHGVRSKLDSQFGSRDTSVVGHMREQTKTSRV